MADEDVRCLVKADEVPQPKPPRYRSKFPGKVDAKAVPCNELGVKQVRPAATFGPGSGALAVSPQGWLAAHAKEPVLPPPTKPASPKLKLKAAVPGRGERPLMGLSSGTDFIRTNVGAAGATPPLHQATEEVQYVLKPWFGEVPPYLVARRREMEERRQQEEQQKQEAADADAAAQMLQGEELAELVRHMKLKWQSINEAYQRLPMVMDTPSKKWRKEEMEAQLAEIERDVKMLQHASVVKIY